MGGDWENTVWLTETPPPIPPPALPCPLTPLCPAAVWGTDPLEGKEPGVPAAKCPLLLLLLPDVWSPLPLLVISPLVETPWVGSNIPPFPSPPLLLASIMPRGNCSCCTMPPAPAPAPAPASMAQRLGL